MFSLPAFISIENREKRMERVGKNERLICWSEREGDESLVPPSFVPDIIIDKY